MREILFRGKRADNGEWVYGSLVPTTVNCYKEGYEIIDRNGIEYDELDYYIPTFCSDEIIPETVGQYTGLSDKNGKKIFEGDIVKAITCDVFGECFEAVVTADLDDFSLMLDIEYSNELEVIGNIHDTPPKK